MSKLEELTHIFGVSEMARMMNVAPYSLYRKRMGLRPLTLEDLFNIRPYISSSDFIQLFEEGLNFFDKN